MNIKQSLIDFSIVFAVALVVAAMVTFLWNLLFHDSAIVNWDISFYFAFTFGIVIALINAKEKKSEER